MQNSVASPTPTLPSGQARYFGGPDITASLEPLIPRSFGELFRSFFLSPVTLNISREKFLSLSKPEQALVKRQRYIVAGTADGPGPRTQDRMPSCSLIIIDVDVHEDARHFVDEESALARLVPCNFVIYRTLSSAPNAARIRIVLDAEPFPSADYPRAVRYVCANLGIAANPESLRWGQPMFLPTACADDETPLICYNLERGPLPYEAFRGYQIPADATSPETGFIPVVSDEPPAADISLEDIEEMLRHLDPDTSYEEWFRILCAIRHQCGQGNKEHDDAGFAIFHDWSSQGSKYTTERDLRAKWRSFRPSPKAGSPVITIRTLLRLAKAAGWGRNHAVTRSMEDLTAAIAAEENGTDLVTRYPALLADANHLSTIEIDVLIGAISARSVKLGTKISIPSVRKAVNLAKRNAAGATTEDGGTVPSWAAGWTFLATENKFVHSHKGTIYPVDGFNGAFKNCVTPDEEGRRPRPADLVLSIPSFPRVDGFKYRPDRGDERIITEEGDNFINSYRATGVDADETTAREAGDLIELHTRLNFPDDEDAQALLISFLAHIVQFPGKKIKWAVFMQGAQGSGKGVYMDMMSTVLGYTNFTIVKDSVINGKFNSWACGKQLVFYDEVLQGITKLDTMNSLKAKISSDFISVEQKHLDVRNEPNTANDFFASNAANGIRIDDTDRRFFVLQSVFQTKKHMDKFRAEHPGYFDRLFRLKDDLAGGARHFLLHYPLHPCFSVNGPAPMTAARDTVVSAGRTDTEWSIQEVINEGNTLHVYGDILSSSALREAMRSQGDRNANTRAIASALHKMGFTDVGQHRIESSIRHSLWAHESFTGTGYGDVMRERCLFRELLGDDIDLL